jgi:NAD(P)-dependent dehydrogenase (short-subunit alcohol dehydrogenase family)
MTPSNRKVAIITGGGRGLGKAYAERLALDGFDIAIADVGDMAALEVSIKALGRTVLPTPATYPPRIRSRGFTTGC